MPKSKSTTAHAFGKRKRKAVFNTGPAKIATVDVPPTPAAPEREGEPSVSASQRKLEMFQAHSSHSASVAASPVSATDSTGTRDSYRIIDIDVFHRMIRSLACTSCGSSDIRCTENLTYGLVSKFQIVCNSCDLTLFDDYTSASVGRSFDINHRFIYSTRAHGLGYDQAAAFLGSMNLPPTIAKVNYYKKLSTLSNACEKALREHLEIVRAIVKEQYVQAGYVNEDDTTVDIGVSYDGTWQKRGHNSHNGIGIAIDILTGYVVDFEVMSNFCITCERADVTDESFMEQHKPDCDKNHDGSSNAMETAAAKIIWERSKDTCLRYTTMLSDGDSKAYDAVREMKPYGDTDIKKEECINHVAKRLTAALDTLVKKHKGTKTSLSGKGGLTKVYMPVLQSYYHNAIKDNKGDVEGMRRAILATPYHVTSSEEQPDHRYCPEKSWCWYKNPEKSRKKPDLPKAFLKYLLPIYEKLSTTELLERCSRVATQNANECVNGVIWNKCSKTRWMGRRGVVIGATLGIMSFNSGESELSKVQEAFGLATGAMEQRLSKKKDKVRKQIKAMSGGVRKSRKHRIIGERQRHTQKEGVTYAAGKFGAD